MDHDLRYIHGSNVTRDGMALLHNGTLQNGDTLLLPSLYRVRYSGQPAAELRTALQEIQSYTCCRDFSQHANTGNTQSAADMIQELLEAGIDIECVNGPLFARARAMVAQLRG